MTTDDECQTCPTCGHRAKKLNGHTMDRSKVQLLEQVARLNLQGHPWVKVQRDGRLIKHDAQAYSIQCDDVHALRLTWFGLLERKERRSGLYRVTPDGFAFLTGDHTVPAKIYCINGTVKEETTERVGINEVAGLILDKPYWDNYAAEQKAQDLGGRLF